jgi:hypothetical protein
MVASSEPSVWRRFAVGYDRVYDELPSVPSFLLSITTFTRRNTPHMRIRANGANERRKRRQVVFDGIVGCKYPTTEPTAAGYLDHGQGGAEMRVKDQDIEYDESTAGVLDRWRAECALRSIRRVSTVRFDSPLTAMMIWDSTVEARRERKEPPRIGYLGSLWEMSSCALYGDYAVCDVVEVME